MNIDVCMAMLSTLERSKLLAAVAHHTISFTQKINPFHVGLTIATRFNHAPHTVVWCGA